MENSENTAESGTALSNLREKWPSFWTDRDKPSPLDLTNAICDGNISEVERLLDAGVSPNSEPSSGDSMLYLAFLFGHFDIAALLRKRGALYGLMEAALAGDTDRISLLLDAGEDVNYISDSGHSALDIACFKGHTDAVRLLLTRGADLNKLNNNRRKPFETACLHDFPEIAHILINAGSKIGIVEAAYLGDLPLLKRFLDNGADIDTQNASEITPLIAASACGHVEVVQFLLDHGANYNFETSTGQSVLTWAVSCDNVSVIHLLIDYGANPNAVSQRGRTPLMDAVTFGKLPSVEALLARGADPNVTGQNTTALFSCIMGASAYGRSKRETMTDIATLLIKAGADIEARTELGRTPLMHAAGEGLVDIVKLLLFHGASVHTSAQEGYATPLSCARNQNILGNHRDQTEVRTLIMEALGQEYAIYDAAERGDLQRLNVLLDAGVPADEGLLFNHWMEHSKHFSRESQEQTPLMAAAENGHIEIVRLLLTRPEIRISSKDKALWSAELRGHLEIVPLLQEAGAVIRRG